MLKLLGSLCILGGGAWIRYCNLSQRRRQRQTLTECLHAMRHMGEEIRMARTPMPVLLERLAAQCQTEAGTLFSAAAASARQGEPLARAWQAQAQTLPVPPESREVLAALSADLHGDEEAMCKAISLATHVLEQHREVLENSRQAEEKRVTALCFSAAALLVILLI